VDATSFTRSCKVGKFQLHINLEIEIVGAAKRIFATPGNKNLDDPEIKKKKTNTSPV